MSQHWTCPYCNRDCTIGEKDTRLLQAVEYISEDYGFYCSRVIIVVCPNPTCRKQKISLLINKYNNPYNKIEGQVYSWHLTPESEAKAFPDYIPVQLRNDYEEACLIKTKSPKASATLSRRCLQGMIRNFWNIKKARLIDEVNELQDKVDEPTWKAIDSVRQVGNIGAHMEKDVDLIIDVDPEETGLLIWLIETLFKEWYIVKHDKEERMNAIVKLAQDKKEEKNKTQSN